MSKSKPRPFETRYFWGANETRRPMSKGFPKAETGSIDGAAKAIAKGLCGKAQCIDRKSGNVVWTLKAGPRVPGLNIRPVEVTRGDGMRPTSRRGGPR